MTTWFVSRHPGAIDWIRKQGLAVDRWVKHLVVSEIQRGDIVIGVLPIPIAAAVCKKGARFFSLNVLLPEELRGKELSAETLEKFGCTLSEFSVQYLGEFPCERSKS